jgi:hypothetical protein
VPLFHPLQPFPRATLWHLLAHYCEGDATFTVPVILDSASAAPDDLPLADRLMSSFHAMTKYEAENIAPEKRPNDAVWEMLRHEKHGAIYHILNNRDVAGLANYLRNGLQESVSYGLGPGPEFIKAMSVPGEARDANICIILDRMASLGEAIGAMIYENPEQGKYGKNLSIDLHEIVASIEQTLSVEIYRPIVMGICGLDLGNGRVIDPRVPDDVYSVHRIRTLQSTFGLQSICEIGGGFGGAAFQAIRAGAQSYTIFDLPVICLVQAWFLIKIFGGDMVKLFGDQVPDRRINVLPYWTFFDRSRLFDLVFNRDSMPEMPLARAMEYLTEISNRGATFLSINQESMGEAGRVGLFQFRVCDLMKSVHTMSRISRHPHWTRKGYVEEVYRPTWSDKT